MSWLGGQLWVDEESGLHHDWARWSRASLSHILHNTTVSPWLEPLCRHILSTHSAAVGGLGGHSIPSMALMSCVSPTKLFLQ